MSQGSSLRRDRRWIAHAVLLVALCTAACEGAPKPPAMPASPVSARADTTPADAVVREFLGWYVTLADSSDERAWGAAMRARPALFGDSLRAELVADARVDATLIDGLDWDPFLNAQDPCELYEAGIPVGSGDTVEVPILVTCQGSRIDPPPFRYRLVRTGGKLRIDNVLRSNGSDLVEQLRILRFAREMRADSLAPAGGPTR